MSTNDSAAMSDDQKAVLRKAAHDERFPVAMLIIFIPMVFPYLMELWHPGAKGRESTGLVMIAILGLYIMLSARISAVVKLLESGDFPVKK